MRFLNLPSVLAALLLLVPASVHAATADAGNNTGPAASSEDALSAATGKLDYQTDMFSGRFGYSVPILVPPARNGSEPSLALRYTSSGDHGWAGQGWELELGHIQRETRNGVPVKWNAGLPLSEYDDTKGFLFSLNGASSRLIHVETNEFRAEIESGFLRFHFLTNSSGNSWRVTDTSGNQFYFGETADSRMVNTKWGSTTNLPKGTFRWALNRSQSVTGTTNGFRYLIVGGAQYPRFINYNGHASGIAPNHQVEFELASRTDVRVAYNSGYRVETGQRLAKVHVTSGGALVRRYDLAYNYSPSTLRSLLTSVTLIGTNGSSSLPATTFQYSQQVREFQTATWTNVVTTWPGTSPLWITPTANNGSGVVSDLVDLDGDALPDRVLRQPNNVASRTNFFFQRNTGAGFGPLETNRWGPLTIQTSGSGTVAASEWDFLMGARSRFVDLNGDGRPDHVMDPIDAFFNSPSTNYYKFVVDYNHGTNLVAGAVWTNVVALRQLNGVTDHKAIENTAFVRLVDLNGDGLPDRVLHRTSGQTPYTNWWVQFNTGTGFGGTNLWGPVDCQGQTTDADWGSLESPEHTKLVDINGDGLPDRVMAPKAAASSAIDYNNFNRFVVQFNNGAGFESAANWSTVNFQSDNPGSTTTFSYIERPPDVFDQAGTALRDFNGDGLPDRILSRYTTPYTNYFVQLNTGTGFTSATFANLYIFGPIGSQGRTNEIEWTWLQSDYVTSVDLNADGLPDRVMATYPGTSYTNNTFTVSLSKGPFPDLLTDVSNGVGGSVKVAYQPAASFPNRETSDPASKGLLPNPMRVVTSVAAGDGLYPFRTNTFSYEGGFYDPVRREFAGFHSVSATDPLGTVQRSWFHQGGGRDGTSLGEYQDAGNFAKRGMRFRSELTGTNGQTYQVTLAKAGQHAYGSSGRYFAFVGQSLNLDYPGTGGGPRATAQSSAYDEDTGNLTESVAWGEVTNVVASTYAFDNVTADDDVYQWTTYATLSNSSIVNRPLRSWTTSDDEAEEVLAESLFTHDGSTGNLLVQRDRFCPDCYLTNRFGYNAYGNLTITTNEAGIVTTTDFDGAKVFPIQQTTASFISQFLHDNKSGAQVWAKDAKGLVSSNVLDGFFRLTSSWVSASSNAAPTIWLEKRSYTLNGISSGSSANSVKVERNDTLTANPGTGHDTYTFTDGLGRVIQVRSESETANTFRVTQTVHDERGAVKVVTQPVFLTGTSYNVLGLANTAASVSEYDPIGRLKQTTSPMNVSFSSGLLSGTPATITETGSLIGPLLVSYNDGNNPWTIVVTDESGAANGLTRKFGLDGFGRTNVIYDVFNATPYATNRFVFDRLGRVTNMVDAAGNKIEYAYNDLGQMVAMADPNLGFWQYERDFAGRVKVQTDGKGNSVEFDYTDPLGRLAAKTITPAAGGGSGYSITYDFDTPDTGGFTVFHGQLAKVTDNQGVERYSYDVRGRTLKVARTLTVNSTTYTSEFLHDQADRQISVAYPASGPIVTNRYDLGGNLTQVQRVDAGGSTLYFQSKGYAAQGELLGATLGNGTEINYTYFPKTRRLQNLTSKKTSAGTNFQALAYTYNQVSDLTAITDSLYSGTNSASISSVAYDNLHRLTSLTRPGASATTYSYNALGNLLTNGEQGGSTYQYGTSGLLPHGVKQVGTNVYAYDLVGNLTHRAGQHLTYDPENRLARVVAGGVTLATFGYDDGGERLWKQSTNTLHVWIGSLYEARGSTNLFHVFAGSRRIATFSPAGQLPGAGGTLTNFHYYHPDHLGSSSLISDTTGAVAEHYEYTAFGRERANGTAAPDVSHRFTGQIFDAEIGLYYYGARYYDANLGRFIQADTIIPNVFDPQSWNRYAYALNNPLKYTDPTGHWPQWMVDLVPSSLPNKLYSSPPGPTYMAADGTLSKGPPQTGGSPKDNLGMLRNEIRGGFDGAGMSDLANKGKTIVSFTPVGVFNDGYTGITGKDAYRPREQVELGDQISSGSQAAGTLLGGALVKAKNVAKTPLWTSTKSETAVENALGHWQRHGAEFPEFQNAKQYAEGAKTFFNNPPVGTLTKTRQNGDKLFYNPVNNTFGVQSANGAPRTMFRPDPAKHGYPSNLDYFNAQ